MLGHLKVASEPDVAHGPADEQAGSMLLVNGIILGDSPKLNMKQKISVDLLCCSDFIEMNWFLCLWLGNLEAYPSVVLTIEMEGPI